MCTLYLSVSLFHSNSYVSCPPPLLLLLLLLLPQICLSHSHSYCCCCFHRPRFAYQVTVAYVGAAGHSEQLLASPAGVAALTASEARQASIAITDYVGGGGAA